jgi:hypothetical protein
MEILESIAWLALGFIPTHVTLEVITSTRQREGETVQTEGEGGKNRCSKIA